MSAIDDLIREYACPDCGARPSLIARGRNVTEVAIAHEDTCPWLTSLQTASARVTPVARAEAQQPKETHTDE